MRRWLIGIAIALTVLVVAVAGIAFFVIDAAAIRGLVVDRASRVLGRPVELGELDLVLFPAPAVRARTLRVAGDAGRPPLLTVEEARLRVAVLPLLSGRVVLAAVELREPAVSLAVGADGMPVLPELGAPGAEGAEPPRSVEPKGPGAPGDGAPPDETAEGTAEPAPDDAGPVRLAIDSFSLEGGRLEAGPWRVSDLDVSGALALDGRSELTASARLDDLGELRDVRVAFEGLGSSLQQIVVRADLAELDLSVLAARLDLLNGPLQELTGRLSGQVEATLGGAEIAVQAASAELTASALRVRAGDAQVAGDVPLRARLGESFEVDLSSAEVRAGDVLEKPSGERLRITGELGSELGPQMLRRVLLALGPNEVPVVPELAAGKLQVEPCTIELAPVAPWVDLGGRSLSGAVRIEQPVTVTLEPLSVSGTLLLADVGMAIEKGLARISGPVVARGREIRFDALQITAGDQTARVTGGYDLEAALLDVDLGIEQADLEALITAWTGSSKFTGTLGGDVKLRGAPSLEALAGAGRFSIAPGQIRDFSLLRQVLGDLAPIAEQVLRSKGKDLEKYEQESFERLDGAFALAEGRMQVRSLVLVYRYGRAELSGTVGLLDEQPLDLAGKVTLAPEVASDILREETDQPLVLPDVPIGGTLSAPRVKIDASLVARALTQVVAKRSIERKLDEAVREKLGGSDADVDAVKGVLEGILGGRKKK